MTGPEENPIDPKHAPQPPWARPVPVAMLRRRDQHEFSISPEPAVLKALSEEFALLDLSKLRFTGRIESDGAGGWRLSGQLGATVQQPCSITLAPVSTRIEEDVVRHFVPDLPTPQPGSETEIPEDDTKELLTATIDPGLVMAETLALALPLFPRAPGARLGKHHGGDAGESTSQSTQNPFTALRDLQDTMRKERADAPSAPPARKNGDNKNN